MTTFDCHRRTRDHRPAVGAALIFVGLFWGGTGFTAGGAPAPTQTQTETQTSSGLSLDRKQQRQITNSRQKLGYYVSQPSASTITDIILSGREDGSTLVRITADGPFSPDSYDHAKISVDPARYLLRLPGIDINDTRRLLPVQDSNLELIRVIRQGEDDSGELHLVFQFASQQVEVAEVAVKGEHIVLLLTRSALGEGLDEGLDEAADRLTIAEGAGDEEVAASEVVALEPEESDLASSPGSPAATPPVAEAAGEQALAALVSGQIAVTFSDVRQEWDLSYGSEAQLPPRLATAARLKEPIQEAAAEEESADETAIPDREGPVATLITDIVTALSSDGSTEVTITGNGRFQATGLNHFPISDPPRYLLRISGIVKPCKAMSIAVSDGTLKGIRIGHHPEYDPPELHLVFDLTTTEVTTEISPQGSRLQVTLSR